jgi:small-conductance mechanosensitive channel
MAPLASYRRSEAWISYLTLILGALAALLVGLCHEARWGTGLMIGAVLAWLNFRWLKQGLDALTETVVAESRGGKGIVPLATYFKALFRYALIALIVYVIFKYLKVPALSMVLGLCALGAATLAVSLHEIFRPQE